MARPKILVFQHVPFEPLGTLDPLLKEAGFRIRYVNFGREPAARPALDRYAALIVLGGPMNADQIDAHPNLVTEVEIIREAVERDMSVLGICLGAQLLAKALGGSVARNKVPEIGWHHVQLTEAGAREPILAAFDRSQEVFQWHEDGISLPPNAVCLARSAVSPVQAFRYGEHAFGFQFHLEASRTLIERWLTVPDHQQVLSDTSANINVDEIRNRCDDAIEHLQSLSHRTFSRWIERFEMQPRKQVMPSK